VTCEKNVDLGAYLLGALAPAERRAMEEHIADCPDCREEIVSLAPLPGLLRHTPFDELPETAQAAEAMRPVGPAGAAQPDTAQVRDTLGEPAPAAEPCATEPSAAGEGSPASGSAEAQRSRRRRRGGRRRLTAAGLALAAAAAGVAITLGVQQMNQHPAATSHAMETLRATDPVSHVAATADLTSEQWGTQVQLWLDNLPPGVTCSLVVHTADGRSETAGTWASGAGYGGATSIPASTSVAPQNITQLDVVTTSGQTLVRMPG
jgi:hypothetical protein